MKKLIYPEEKLLLYIQEYQNGKSLAKICGEYKLNKATLSRNLKEAGIMVTKRKYLLDETSFETINKHNAYWLGFIAADGCVQATGDDPEPKVLSFNLNIRDKNHLEKFKNFIKSNAIIKEQHGSGYGEGTMMAHLEINSKKLVQDLEKYGIYRAKSNILKPPNIPKEYYKDWIRGYLDGDGSISILEAGRAQISFEGTKEVLTFIKNFLTPEKDKYLSKRHPESDKNNYHLAYGGTNLIISILHKLYDNSTDYLDRKYQKALEIYSRFEK